MSRFHTYNQQMDNGQVIWVDPNIAKLVIIETELGMRSQDKMKSFGIKWSHSSSATGQRWREQPISTADVPRIYGFPLRQLSSNRFTYDSAPMWLRFIALNVAEFSRPVFGYDMPDVLPLARIHRLDGQIETINIPNLTR